MISEISVGTLVAMPLRPLQASFSCIPTGVSCHSSLYQQLRGDKIWTELRAAGGLAGASRPRGHHSLPRPSAETAVCPQQGVITCVCRYCTSPVLSNHSRCVCGITDAAFPSCFSCCRHEGRLLTDPIYWPCLLISQTGPLSCSVSALSSANTETTSRCFLAFVCQIVNQQ